MVTEQQKNKSFQLVKDGKYKLLFKKKVSRYTEFKKQVDQVQAVMAIIDQLNQEYPSLLMSLEKVVVALREMYEKYAPHEEEEEGDVEEVEEEKLEEEIEVEEEEEKFEI